MIQTSLQYVGRPSPLRLIPYADCRDQIHTGYTALFAQRSRGLVEWSVDLAIQHLVNSVYFHVVALGWEAEKRVLMMAESTSPESRSVTFSSQVREHSGGIDVYALRPEIAAKVDFACDWEFMLRASGLLYPDGELLRDFEQVVLGRGQTTPNSDVPDGKLRVCSELRHAALRCAGMPPMQPLDAMVWPRHFPDPAYWLYMFSPTLD